MMNTLPTAQTLRALDAANFFVAAVLAGFGPFVAVFLGARGWSQQDIGFVLSAAGIAGLLSQIPGGELLDVTRSKRLLVGAGTLMLAGGALIIAIRPDFLLVFAALVLQGATAGFLGPGIVAISLGIVGRSGLAERLGRNQRFKSTGSLLAAAVMGAIGYFLSDRMIFFATAALALPTLFALMRIHAADIHFGRSVGAPDHHEPTDCRSGISHRRSNTRRHQWDCAWGSYSVDRCGPHTRYRSVQLGLGLGWHHRRNWRGAEHDANRFGRRKLWPLGRVFARRSDGLGCCRHCLVFRAGNEAIWRVTWQQRDNGPACNDQDRRTRQTTCKNFGKIAIR